MKEIRELDKALAPKGSWQMLLFLSEAFYFIIAVSIPAKDLKWWIYLTVFFCWGAVLCGIILPQMQREGNRWVPVYEKIKYFPIDRSRYIRAKLYSVLKYCVLQAGIAAAVFLYREVIGNGAGMKEMVFIALSISGSSLWFWSSMTVLTMISGRIAVVTVLPGIVAMGLLQLLL